MKKINGILIAIAVAVLLYTRFVNLSWGLPYPFHPDERNMAVALQQLSCNDVSSIKDCFNPHFFAYGQLPLYMGYFFIKTVHFMTGRLGTPILFEEAAIALRTISALASIFTVFVGVKTVEFLTSLRLNIKNQISKTQSKNQKKISMSLYGILITLSAFTFSPGLIQFAHFGTTESLLMLVYMGIIYFSLQLVNRYINILRFTLYVSLLCGLAIATKISAAIFLAIPMLAVLNNSIEPYKKKGLISSVLNFVRISAPFLLLTAFFTAIFSPHNLININDFISSMNYESAIGLGKYIAFYTRQFVGTVPILFQTVNIFPYALGWPAFVLFLAGFFFLPYTRNYNLLRLAFLIYFLPNAFFFSKWTRFVAPVFPLMIVFAVSVLIRFYELVSKLKTKKSKTQIEKQNFFIWIPRFTICLLIFTLILPGAAYLSVYKNEDSRFEASDWIYDNVPEGSYILSEAANVVDLPVSVKRETQNVKRYNIVSFDFYALDENPLLSQELSNHIDRADYILVPSRRVFANHGCSFPSSWLIQDRFWSRFTPRNDVRCKLLKEKYPLLNEYYEKLFSGNYGFKQVAEISSYPKLQILRFNFNFPDEQAEETWSVFDHPVIRVYRRI